jgi:glycosyltransferase involved in cell wall biosynthesis
MNQSVSHVEPVISVLLPCCNGGHTLGLAIHSLLVQTFADFEIIFLNDGSSDDSVTIARSFADPRIRILGDDTRRGLPVRLNEGVLHARGRFIARMDADDVSFPKRFERQLAYLQSHPGVDLLGCRALVFSDEGLVLGMLPFAATHGELCAQTWRNIPLPHPSWMGRREWFLRNPYRLPEVRRAEDQELLLRSSVSSEFACLDEVLLAYRQGPFQFPRTWVARRSLLAAQIGLFVRRKEWILAIKAFLSAVLKIGVDCLCALPGLQRFFFLRMREPVPAAVSDQLQGCLSRYARLPK